MHKIALLLLSLLPLRAAEVSFLPVNAYHVDTGEDVNGLVFYFEEPPAASAVITVVAIQNGKPSSATQVIDTDRVHGERLVFYMQIDEEHRYKLVQLTIEMAGKTYTIERPQANMHYRLDLRRTSISIPSN